MKKRLFAKAMAFAMTAVMVFGSGTINSNAMYSCSMENAELNSSDESSVEGTVYTDLPTAMSSADKISMNQTTVTIDGYDNYLLDGNVAPNYETAKLYELPNGYYTMELTVNLTDDMVENGNYPTVCFFNDQNYMYSRTNWAQSRDEYGKRIYTFVVEEYYSNGGDASKATSYIWISNMPEGTTGTMTWTTPQEIYGMKEQAIELTVKGDGKDITNPEYIKIPNWRSEPVYGENEEVAFRWYISHYSIVKGAVYKVTLEDGLEASIMGLENAGANYRYFSDLTTDNDAEIYINDGELKNDSGSEKIYYILAYSYDPNCDFSNVSLSVEQIPVISEELNIVEEITSSVNIEDVTTSIEMYKAVSNLYSYDLRYNKGYGNLYKITVPKKQVLTINCSDKSWNGFVYSAGKMDQYTENWLYPPINSWDSGNSTLANSSDADKEYYLWISYDEQKSYNVEFKYLDMLLSKYEMAYNFTGEEIIEITDAANQGNYVADFYSPSTENYGLLYHFPEGEAVITVELNSDTQLDVLDEYGNTGYVGNASYRGEGIYTIYTSNYNCRGKEGWVLLSAASKEALNGCSIKYEKQKEFTEQDKTNVLELNVEYACSSQDKVLELNGIEYYAYSFDMAGYDTAEFNISSSAEQSDYANMKFINDFGGDLFVSSVSSNEAKLSLLKTDLNGIGTNIILLIPKTYEQYGMVNGMWGPMQCTTQIEKVKIKVTLPPTLADFKDQAIELTDGNVFIQEKTENYSYIMDRSSLFKTTVPKGYSATLRLRNQAFYKNAAVYDDFKSAPVAIDEHEGYSTILLDIPANNETDKLYYIDAYNQLYKYSDTQIEIILKDEWRKNNTFDKYAVGVSATDKIIDLSKLEDDGLIVENIKNVTNGTYDSGSKNIKVEDISKAVSYEYKIYDHYVTMRLIPYVKSDEAVLVSEGQTTDSDGNTVENLVEVSAEGELSAVVTETTMNSVVSDESTFKLTEKKDISGENTNDAAVTLEQGNVTSTDIQKVIEVAEVKNQSYSDNRQSAIIDEITVEFENKTNSQINSEIFAQIRTDEENSKKGFDISIAKKDEQGNDEYVWKFKGSEITDTTKSLNPDMDIQEEGYNDKIQDLVAEDKELTILNFKNSGILPGTATVKIYVGEKYKDGQEVICSYFDEANNSLTEEQNVTVIDGYVTISITHCSDYVLEADKAAEHVHSVVVDKAVSATCTKTGLTEGSHCGTCKAVLVKQEVVDKIPHTYNQKSVSDKTIKSKATTESAALYYYSCSCGAIGTETFPWGEPLTKPEEDTNPTDKPSGAGDDKPEDKPEAGIPTDSETVAVDVKYHTHIQNYGDSQGTKMNGEMAGTSGESKRLESIWIEVEGNDKLGIQYTTHCQSYGWMPWSTNGEINGTSGESKRLEAIMIRLTGEDADKYDVYYRVHAQNYGWLGWAKNGQVSGTSGQSKRLEGIQIVIVPVGESFSEKMGGYESVMTESYINGGGSSPVLGQESTDASNPVIEGGDAPYVMYKTHVQTYGWQQWVINGAMSGTSGESKRLEGINIKVSNMPYDGDIVYTTHVQTYGWQGDLEDQSTWKKNGEMSGTNGESKRLEAICINLTGEMAEHYDIYYRVHAQNFGWLGWAKNGEQSGTAGHSKRLEGIQIILVPKDGKAPGLSYNGITSDMVDAFIQK